MKAKSSKLLFSPLLSLLWVLVLCLSPLQAAPQDPFAGAAPAFDAAPREATNYNVGDWGVAEQNGAVTYTYPIRVPPGRNGMTPSLALRYSSQSSLRGSLAVGWSLDLPTIRIDSGLGVEAESIYRAALGGATGRLVEVADTAPAASKAYRVDVDDTFTRFFRFTRVDAGTRWQAWTTDGVIHDFGDEPAAGDREFFWPVTRQTDRFGNTVQYVWAKSTYGYFVSYDPQQIEYTANANAGLAAHARLEFVYAADHRCHAAPMPLGSSPMASNMLAGARQLDALKIFVRNEANGDWQLRREVKLTYKLRASQLHFEEIVAIDPSRPPSNNCRGQAPLRYLTQIQETAYAPDGGATTLPALTFAYNHRQVGPYASLTPSPFPSDPAHTIPAPGFAQAGTSQDGATVSLLDMDADGIRDRIQVITENEVCTLVWYRGRLGGEFETEMHKSPLPTMPWFYQTEHDGPPYALESRELCTLGGQITWREVSMPPDPQLPKPTDHWSEKGVFVYSFMDYTRDGRIDLLTSITGVLEGEDPPYDLDHLVTYPEPVKIDEMTAPQTATWYLYPNYHELPFPNWNDMLGVESDFSVKGLTIAAPVPLGATGSEGEVEDPTVTVKGMPPALFDLDGDGYLDAIIRSEAPGGDMGDCYSPVPQPPFWCVFFGNGGQTFRAGYKWSRPINLHIGAGVSGYLQEDRDLQGRYHIRKWDVAALQDVDGDGLADLVVQEEVQPNSYSLRAYRNLGWGFADSPLGLGRVEPIEKTQTDYAKTNSGDIIDGARGYRRRLLDLDSDGLVDILFVVDDDEADKNNITRDQKTFAVFNFGGFFTPGQNEMPVEWRVAKRLFHAQLNDDVVDRVVSDWSVRTDFYDATGDGLADMVTFADDGRSMSVVEHPGLPAAPDLLKSVENGRGLRREFVYAPTTDAAVVQRAPDEFPLWDPVEIQLNQVKWVVTEMRVTGGAIPLQVTRYTYKNPITYSVKKDALYPEPARFAGFATVTRTEYNETEAPLRQVIHQYDYKLAPDGHLQEEWIYRAENGAFKPHRYTQYYWTSQSMFDSRTAFIYQYMSRTRTCLSSARPAECAAQSENVHWSGEDWAPVSATGAASLCPADVTAAAAAVLWVHVQTESGSGLSSGPLDRRTLQCFQVRYGQSGFAADDYRILPTKSVQEATIDNLGLRFEVLGQTETYYDPASGLPVQTDEWLDAATVASTKRGYDSRTGNLLWVVNPEQASVVNSALAQAPAETAHPNPARPGTWFQYDAHALFVQTTINQLNHRVITTYDMATGALLERKGPNFATLPSNETVWARETWRIDGFGRVLEHAVSLDDATTHYVLHTVQKTSYFDAELPNRVRSEQLLDIGGSRWVTVDQTLDGLGRIMSETQLIDGGLTSITTYTYDSAGNLAATEVPDPRTDDGTRLRYTYVYDGLGRLTHFTRPDGNGIAITYAGLEKTSQEVTGDNSGATKKEVYDVYGRLVELHELDPAAQTAITRYYYDGDDNLVMIVDTEDNQTHLGHDWLGRRIAVTRGGRTWRYTYDRNGNLRTRTAPVPAGADPASYTTTYLYDVLDRVLEMSFTDQQITALTALPIDPAPTDPVPPTVPVPPPDPAPEVPGQTSSHTIFLPTILQTGPANEIAATVAAADPVSPEAPGQPSDHATYLPTIMKSDTANESVQAAVTSAPVLNTIRYTYDEGPNGLGRLSRVDLPFGNVHYTYEARGLVAREERSFRLTDVATASATQAVQRQYNALGLPTLSQWDDGQQWQISYDGRGLVDQVQWYNPQAQSWQAVADFERSLAGLARVRASAFGQTRQYSYDLLARPAQETVTVNGNPLATRAYGYNGSGDLIHVTGATAGVSAEASYTYDAQHRLTSAAGPNGYAGAFSYSATGNLLTANVTWAGSPETRNVRYEYGARDPQAVDRLVDQASGNAYAAFSYDLAGNMTQRTVPGGELGLLWDSHDHLRMVAGPHGTEVYFYDQNGMRMLAVSAAEGIRFWFGESETHYDLAAVQTKRYLHLSAGGAALARVENGSKLELQYADALQNLMFSLDTAGNVIASFLYGPFGEVVQATGDADHRRQFNGKENDAVSGLRYYGYRYYDPLTLRWNSADPLYRVLPDLGLDEPQRLNLYTFSLNNPVRYYDPDGHDANKADKKSEESEKTTCEAVEAKAEICVGKPEEVNADPYEKESSKRTTKGIVNDARSANCKDHVCAARVIKNVAISMFNGDRRKAASWLRNNNALALALVDGYVQGLNCPPGTWQCPGPPMAHRERKGIPQTEVAKEAKAYAELGKLLTGGVFGAVSAGSTYVATGNARLSVAVGSAGAILDSIDLTRKSQAPEHNMVNRNAPYADIRSR